MSFPRLVFSGLVTALLVVGCGDTRPPTDPGGISVYLVPASVTLPQGGSQAVTATLTRAGGYTGTVDLSITGQPAGVSAAVSDPQTIGAVTTATVTIQVGSGVAPAEYPLILHGVGSGVGEVTYAFALTVTAPSISLHLVPGGAIVWQGNGADLHATLTRAGGFTGDVDVTVTGAPAGVTVTVLGSRLSDAATSAYASIEVGTTAAPGVYSLVVHGTGGGVAEATGTFMLTIMDPGFVLSLSSPAVSIAPGGSATVDVTLARTGFAGPVTLGADMYHFPLPDGVTAVFAPGTLTGTSSVLTITVAAGAAPGVYDLSVVAFVTEPPPTGYVYVPLTLTVAPAGH